MVKRIIAGFYGVFFLIVAAVIAWACFQLARGVGVSAVYIFDAFAMALVLVFIVLSSLACLVIAVG